VGSAEVILLDTHVAIWMIDNNPALGAASRKIIQSARQENRLTISAISFWEIALLVSKDRLEFRGEPRQLRLDLSASGVTELPITGDIALRAVELENLHADPADRFIAATAVAHDATLMTADKRLLRWGHGVRRQNAAK
jgi:PIN domain nuclease of toxin-antitoxin system